MPQLLLSQVFLPVMKGHSGDGRAGCSQGFTEAWRRQQGWGEGWVEGGGNRGPCGDRLFKDQLVAVPAPKTLWPAFQQGGIYSSHVGKLRL